MAKTKAKIEVVLTASYDDGKVQHSPGDIVSLEKSLADRLLDLGMAKAVDKSKPKKKVELPPEDVDNATSDDSDAAEDGASDDSDAAETESAAEDNSASDDQGTDGDAS